MSLGEIHQIKKKFKILMNDFIKNNYEKKERDDVIKKSESFFTDFKKAYDNDLDSLKIKK